MTDTINMFISLQVYYWLALKQVEPKVSLILQISKIYFSIIPHAMFIAIFKISS